MPEIIRSKDIPVNIQFDPPFAFKMGIHSATVKGRSPKMIMGSATVPPGGKDKRHFNLNCDFGIYILKGRLSVSMGPEYQKKELISEAGDFVQIPRGEIHGFANLSSKEPVEFYFCFGEHVSNEQEIETIFVEPPAR